MITAYVMREGGLDAMQLKTEDNRLPQDAIWLDAYRLSDEEREWLTDVILKDVPEEEELDDIEASSRFFRTPTASISSHSSRSASATRPSASTSPSP